MKISEIGWEGEVLSDKLWSGYAAYVVAHCESTRDSAGRTIWSLDDTASELLALAQNWDVHRTF